MLHLLGYRFVTRNGCMALIQALGRDFAGMINAHQARGMAFFTLAQVSVGNAFGRVFAGSSSRRGYSRSQGIIDTRDEPVKRGKIAFLHAAIITRIIRGRFWRFDMKTCRLIAIVLPIFASAAVAADEEAPSSPWAGKVTLGYLATSGNTDNSNLNTGFEVAYTTGDWQHSFDASAIYATESSNTTAEAYAAGWKSERQLSETNFLFGRLNWRKDRFSSYATQFSQTLGYGRRIINNKKHSLNGEVGAGARQSELANGSNESELILSGALHYTWAISETAEFRQDLLVEAGSENTYFESTTALSARLVGNLALVASYTIKSNSEVLVGTEKTDTFTAVSLEYAF
jgi:putative salt-induced outer membrane protein